MMWFAKLIDSIDHITGLGNLSYLIAGGLVILITMGVMSLFKK